MDKLNVGIVSLGCDKNRIDSEIILGSLSNKYKIVSDPKLADIIIVNTCGFIEDAKQESINSILDMAKYKEKYHCKVLVATGCLTQRYGKEIAELIPEIDILMGVNNYNNILVDIDNFLKNNEKILDYENKADFVDVGQRVISTGTSSAYIRISEGCNNYCTYCIIPKIRGKYRSRKLEEIIKEAKVLASQGVKELILVAQDTTNYGIDIYGEKKLHILLQELSKIESIKWIRLLYCYAEEITDEIILEIKNNKKVCKYIDMPIQHISNRILKRMNRKGRKEEILDVIDKLRKAIPDICLRTTLIVGFPGETQEDFNELLEFVRTVKFNKLGVFKYSQEENTVAAGMDDQIDEELKTEREKQIMILQQSISKQLNESKIGKSYEIIVESYKDGIYGGRSYEMSPEIDGTIIFKCDKIIDIGEMINIKIVEAFEYDLMGVVNDESSK